MKKILRWSIGVLIVLIALLMALVLARDVLLKAAAERSIEEETGLRAVIGELHTSLGSGALHIRNLKLYNPAEFGGRLMADAPEVFVDLDAAQAADGKLHFRNLKLVLSELNVVKSTAGRFNIEGVEKRIREHLHRRKHRHREKFEFEFAGIEQMHLTVGKVFYTDLKRPQHSLALNLAMNDETVTDLKTEDDLESWAAAMVFRIIMQVSLKQLKTPTGAEAGADSAIGPGAKEPISSASESAGASPLRF
jgi:uncharacterized protein involved in outer membrane biogenesis